MKLRVLLTMGVVCLVAGVAYAQTFYECEVSASAVFATGEVMDGYARDDSVEVLIGWMHDSTDGLFETEEADEPLVPGVCRRNGTVSADFVGTRKATYNEVLEYSYFISIEDNRGPPDSVILVASIMRRPTRRSEGTADFSPPRTVVVPAEIDVIVGGAGTGWTRLHLDEITCHYRGTGTTSELVRCTDPLDTGYVAGNELVISHARLRIQQADRSFDLTSVEVDIGTGLPQAGAPDYYSILIGDPSGAPAYSFTGLVEDGDIAITLGDPILTRP